MRLILGSESIFREDLMRKASYHFDILTADIDEKLIRSDQPEALVCVLAQAKAEAIIEKHDLGPDVFLITSDQVVYCSGKILEKPLEKDGTPSVQIAKAYLVGYANHPATTYTSVYALNTKNGQAYCGYDVTSIWFEKFTPREMEIIVSDVNTYKAAGALATSINDSPASAILESKIKRIEGEKTGFVGLPMTLVTKALQEIGYYKQ